MGSYSLALSFRLLVGLMCLLSVATSAPGQMTVIPTWKVQSSSKTGDDVSKLSAPNLTTSDWYTIGSHGTLMATLIDNKVYNDTDLFFSTNLQKVDSSQFQIPWYYRTEIQFPSVNGSHFQLMTNGISSRADIYLNTKQIADKNIQAGAYAGLTYDITSHVKSGSNILLIRVYPTDYNRDLAIGFVDWNPSPPDNGTGIWRDIEIKQTGPVSLNTPRVVSTLRSLEARVSVRVDVQNLVESQGQSGEVVCSISDPQGRAVGNNLRAEFQVASKEQQKLVLNTTINEPRIWWPKQWGAQPLYTVQCNASTGAGLSDTTPTSKFGIRTVTSNLNDYNDTIFRVNEKPFQVLGAGYTSDIFLRFSPSKLRSQFQYVLDMGLNTVRLEGKQEHPYLYELADELGLMILAGWECCDKWEGWSYNDEGSGQKWNSPDYTIANNSMRHEAEMMQHHPSMLGFLVGSDFWPDDRATTIYVSALKAFDWDIPIISSASQRGFPKELGNGGMKMEGPYDWVPPNYWYGDQLIGDQLGGAFGFASELGAGVGTPELNSLKKFLSPGDIEDLWKSPEKGLYHMSTNTSSFYDRKIYNNAIWKRYGAPTSLEDYEMKAQMADYEATRSQFEAYSSHWGAARQATGMIYWMLNNAWPSLHWNLFDYYLHPSAAYFGAKLGARTEHVVLDYSSLSMWMVNHRLDRAGMRTIDVELMSLNGTSLNKFSVDGPTEPNGSKYMGPVLGWDKIEDVALLRLTLTNRRDVISTSTYWISSKSDVLDWGNSTWYYTPTTEYANYTALNTMQQANVSVTVTGKGKVRLENKSKIPAVFVRLNLVDGKGQDIVPVQWSDNYVTLWPEEKLDLHVDFEAVNRGSKVVVDGKNVKVQSVTIGGEY